MPFAPIRARSAPLEVVYAESDAVVVAEVELRGVAVKVRLGDVEIAAVDPALEDREVIFDRVCVPEVRADVLFRRVVHGAMASELVADCFALAREIRTVDMRASPYDLSELGYAPIRVESPEGRADYIAAQREFADRAAVLRRQLIVAIDTAAAFDASASVPELNAECSPLGR